MFHLLISFSPSPSDSQIYLFIYLESLCFYIIRMEKHLSLMLSRRSPFTLSGVPSLIDTMLLDDTQDSKFRKQKINSYAGTAFLVWHAGLQTQRMIAEGQGTWSCLLYLSSPSDIYSHPQFSSIICYE